jgi:hypothetical protein
VRVDADERAVLVCIAVTGAQGTLTDVAKYWASVAADLAVRCAHDNGLGQGTTAGMIATKIMALFSRRREKLSQCGEAAAVLGYAA